MTDNSNPPHTATAYKILTTPQWDILRTEGLFTGAPIDVQDGYIHLSTAEQVTETVDKHFTGQTGLWIAAVDLPVLGDAVRWEASRGRQLFPHIYAALPMQAVIAAHPLSREDDGAVTLPR